MEPSCRLCSLSASFRRESSHCCRSAAWATRPRFSSTTAYIDNQALVHLNEVQQKIHEEPSAAPQNEVTLGPGGYYLRSTMLTLKVGSTASPTSRRADQRCCRTLSAAPKDATTSLGTSGVRTRWPGEKRWNPRYIGCWVCPLLSWTPGAGRRWGQGWSGATNCGLDH